MRRAPEVQRQVFAIVVLAIVVLTIVVLAIVVLAIVLVVLTLLFLLLTNVRFFSGGDTRVRHAALGRHLHIDKSALLCALRVPAPIDPVPPQHVRHGMYGKNNGYGDGGGQQVVEKRRQQRLTGERTKIVSARIRLVSSFIRTIRVSTSGPGCEAAPCRDDIGRA